MAKIKESKLKILSQQKIVIENNNVHTCPVANVSYRGLCPNVTCPANISQSRTSLSGCFLEKGKPSLIEASLWFKKTTHEIKKKYNKSLKRIDRFVTYYNFLQNYREFKSTKCCPKCGKDNEHGLECLNGKRCDKRHRLYLRAKQRFPFNVSALNVTPQEFWAINASTALEEILPKKIRQKSQILA